MPMVAVARQGRKEAGGPFPTEMLAVSNTGGIANRPYEAACRSPFRPPAAPR
ncbi:MAG: hypothetical protein AVDCRST_MAG19-5015 [uncultured Thermomicrobiales bacterium]|uniref:Uncharacterized protein n=1 Tax=uncultured Thermomicrobiales bacterium TaxID=1645740 RepID=A0A6J4VY29_9BACT|nr:MAG: hypothetical protein AVDCRST_MAG19-5015 [uncultured Thermomicrobiales bacterium]